MEEVGSAAGSGRFLPIVKGWERVDDIILLLNSRVLQSPDALPAICLRSPLALNPLLVPVVPFQPLPPSRRVDLTETASVVVYVERIIHVFTSLPERIQLQARILSQRE